MFIVVGGGGGGFENEAGFWGVHTFINQPGFLAFFVRAPDLFFMSEELINLQSSELILFFLSFSIHFSMIYDIHASYSYSNVMGGGGGGGGEVDLGFLFSYNVHD